MDPDERIRTLEDALRPFVESGHDEMRHHPGRCLACSVGTQFRAVLSWPCKFETARRALEGE